MNGHIEIGDIDNVLKLLGEVYDDPRDALAEFITNGIDARATEISIEIRKKSKNPYILISDNGFGMDKKELERIATNIGLSIKRFDPDNVGEKGIGILGYVNFGNEMKIISRMKYSKTHSLLVRGSHYEIKEEEKREARGTDVYIYGTDKKSHLITQKKLNNYYKEKFRQKLSTEEIKLYITDGKKNISVRPDIYKGEPFPIFEQKTDYGTIKFSLFMLPPNWQKSTKVSIYRKGILVVDDISQMDEFESNIWKMNKVQGEINVDFCDITSGRSGFIRDQKFESFVEGIKNIEPDLERYIKEKDNEFRKSIDNEIYKELNITFNKVLDDLEDFEKFKIQMKSKAGGEINGEETNRKTPTLIGGNSKKKGNGKPIVKSGNKPIRTRRGRGFNWEEIPFDSEDMMSRLDLLFNTIEINTIHPNYKEVINSPEDKRLYLLRLTAKEIALFNYREAKPEILLEKEVGLEIRAENSLAELLS